MDICYFDNAATSFPKPYSVAKSVSDYIMNIGCNVNRGAYGKAYEAEETVLETRELIAEFFHYNKYKNIIFTRNITESLNVLIKGLLKKGDHVIVSSMEHNAVMRPLATMIEKGVELTRVPCSISGELILEKLSECIKENTKAVIMTQASNVCGTIMPLKEVGEFCDKNNLFFIVDSAQGAGFMDMDISKLHADAIAFTGHKGLLGPQGIGGFIISDKLIPIVPPLIEGGTGSLSEQEIQPEYMPDKYEAGTMNVPNIFGLNASLKYIKNIGLNTIYEKEMELTQKFIEEVRNMKNIRVTGVDDIKMRTAVVSLDFTSRDNSEVAFTLANEFNIYTRCGLHCSPSAHKTIGTFPHGTVRFSFSHLNTLKEIDYAINSINSINSINL